MDHIHRYVEITLHILYVVYSFSRVIQKMIKRRRKMELEVETNHRYANTTHYYHHKTKILIQY